MTLEAEVTGLVRLFGGLAGAADDVFFLLTPEGRLVVAGEGAESVLGVVATHASLVELVGEARASQWRLMLAQAARGDPVTFEESHVHAGHTLSHRIRLVPTQKLVLGIARDISEDRRRERHDAARDSVAEVLSRSTTLRDAAVGFLEAACKTEDYWVYGELFVVDRGLDRIRCLATWHRPEMDLAGFDDLSQEVSFAPSVGLPGRVWAEGRPLWVHDVQRDVNFPRAAAAHHAGLHSAFGFPLFTAGRVAGTLSLYTRDLREADATTVRMLAGLGGHMGQFLGRLRVEEALRESEERLRVAAEAGRMGTWAWNPATGAAVCSENLEDLHGGPVPGSLEAYLGIVHPDDRERTVSSIRRCLDEGVEHRIEYRVMRPDGRVAWLEARGRMLRDESGRAEVMAGVLMDVTERKTAEFNRAARLLVTRLLAEARSLDEAGPRLLEAVAANGEWKHAQLWIDTERGLCRLSAWTAPGVRTLPERETLRLQAGEGVVGRAFRMASLDWKTELAGDPAFAHVEGVDRLGAVAAPFGAGERVAGVIALLRDERQPLHPAVEQTLLSLGTQIGQSVERWRAEALVHRSREEMRLLSEAGRLLASSHLDYEGTLTSMARILVPHVARACVMHLVDDDVTMRRLVLADADPGQARALIELHELYSADEGAREALRLVLATGRSQRVALGPGGSAAIVPLAAQNTVLGAIACLRTDFFDQMELAENLAHRGALAIQNARLYKAEREAQVRLAELLAHERDVMQVLVQSFLGSTPRLDGLEVASLYRAAFEAERMGGDYFDFIEIDPRRVGIVIGDVSGKGVAAGVYTAMAKYSLRSYAFEDPTPSVVVERLNKVLYAAMGSECMFVTLLYGVLDVQSGELQYVNAGHPPPVIFDGALGRLVNTGGLVGALPHMRFGQASATLGPGAMLALFTDGVVEVRGRADPMSDGGVGAILEANADASCEQVARAIMDHAQAQAEGQLRDDVAIVVLRRAPQGAGT